ncbi:Thermophilic serine proteinase precursor [Gemmata sp. SH-PL17]|uniref:S8 family serine peptidase n=1 Tax=Gemmata sp. SH-PL17 TaxID=1630693 RepID=UPI0004B51881|nr:S8 family serine peptidase [Gemmata sp. SH-PL17]AMV29734.1 Thermophilic serine proteinase precursor [Gemmata sp. SH-PL17]
MGAPRGPRFGRSFLQVEHLEDRTTPSYNPALPLNQQIAAGDVAGDRIIVVANSGAALSSAPFVSSVHALGNNTYSVRLNAGTDVGGALAYYGGVSGVAWAEPDVILRAAVVPNDPSYGSMYGPAKIGAEAAWNITTGNSNFVVGVIDSGVDYTHPDLAANMWRNPGEIPGNNTDDDGNGYVDDVYGWDFINGDNDPMDDNGHGTHVSGTIGAVGNNNVGVTGINWNVKIMGLKFLGANNSGPISAAIEAVNYSAKMGVKVTNNSWGGGGYSQALARSIALAQSAGQIFVVAAGNSGQDNDVTAAQPANYSTSFDNVITVAATDDSDELADFSQYGARTVTLAAPGVGILSTTPGDSYGLLDGTSMASPHVAGAIALYWGANPTLSYTQVVNKLKNSVDKLSNLTGKVSTGGRLNVAKMFNLTDIPPIVVDAPAGSEIVRVLGTGGETKLALDPYRGFLGGVVAAAGDLNGDGVADVVTAATLGGHVKVFDGATGQELRSFFGFAGYKGPINLAIGDVNGDGVGDIIIAANLNGHVKVFDGATGALTFSSFVYQGYQGSIAVSVADTDGDGNNDLVTAADGGAGVHVKAFAQGTLSAHDSFFATGPGDWSNFSISTADLDLDGTPELMVSQGPRVRVLNLQTKAARADFLAFDPLSKDRITVQAARYTGDPSAELVVIRETQGRSQVRVFDGPNYTLEDSFFADVR